MINLQKRNLRKNMLTKEQLEFRRSKIGASDAPIIMGVSPYKTRYQLWLEKTTGQFSTPTANMRHGTEYEETIRKQVEAWLGVSLFPKVFIHPERDWQMASLDGIDIDETVFVEIKRANKEDHQLAKDGKIPEKYIPQLQHQFSVLVGKEWSWYASSHKDEMATVMVTRDDKYIEELVAVEDEFYRKHILEKIPPEKVAKDFEDEVKEAVLMESFEWNDIAIRYKSIKEQLESLSKVEAELKDKLIDLSGGRNCYGAGIKLMKAEREGAVDYKKVPELKGVNLDAYRKAPVVSWRTLSY